MLAKVIFAVAVTLGGCFLLNCCDAQLAAPFFRPGYCPYRAPQAPIGSCAVSCANDTMCADNEKCCSNGCGRECQVLQNVPLACNVHCPPGQQCQFVEPPWCYPFGSCMLWPNCFPGGGPTCDGFVCPAGQICQITNGVPGCVPACSCPCPASSEGRSIFGARRY